MSDCIDQTPILTTIIASGLLVISEILPYFKEVKGNGIVQAIISGMKNFLAKNKIQDVEEPSTQE